MKKLYLLYGSLLTGLLVYSYIFVDTNLWFFQSPSYLSLQQTFKTFLIENRILAGIIYILVVLGLFSGYWLVLQGISKSRYTFSQLKKLLIFVSIYLLASFPGFSYDLFNYIATARVAYHWQENPWLTMPVDIPNEPALAYTRAANKVALYGPTWIALTFLPHIGANGNIFLSILTFKLLIYLCFLLFLILVYKTTKNLWQTSFFAFNPLILMEVVLGGHNDITMMLLALAGIVLYISKQKWGFFIWFLSIFVKGATIVLLPLFFLNRLGNDKVFFIGYWLIFAVFLITPFREEMYPWYAVWWLSFVVFLPLVKYRLLYLFSVFFSFGLIFRHVPYIMMGYYEGPGPLLRILSTLTPVIVFIVIYRMDLLKFLYYIYRHSGKSGEHRTRPESMH